MKSPGEAQRPAASAEQSVRPAAAEPRATRGRLEFWSVVALPFGSILVAAVVWLVAASRSGFWADDFLNLTTFYHSLGHLSDDHVNTGKYIINVFWALGTELFGNSSVVPFLVSTMLIFATGTALWLTVGTRSHWGVVEAWWIGGIFIAVGAWLPTALWSSNVTHSGGFLALGVGFWAYERAIKSESLGRSASWSVASGIAWTLAVVSNLLYIGLLPIAAYCAFHQFKRLTTLDLSARRAAIFTGLWSIALPIAYFAAIGYPATKSSSAYAATGLSYVRTNFDFYRSVLAPSAALVVMYVALIVAGVVGGILAMRRREWFAIAVLLAAGATAVPALVQGQQREIHYMAMPLLLLLSSLGASAHELRLVAPAPRRRVDAGLGLAAGLTLILVFLHASDLRSAWISEPYGSDLATFRSQVAQLAPAGGVICARMAMTATQETAFIDQMENTDGFYVPPIDAGAVFLLTGSQACPAPAPNARLTIAINPRGNWVATAEGTST